MNGPLVKVILGFDDSAPPMGEGCLFVHSLRIQSDSVKTIKVDMSLKVHPSEGNGMKNWQ